MLRRRLAATVGLWAAAAVTAWGCEPTNQGYAPEQPINYSHAVHAGTLQIPCQYCHFSAERGRHAGIPPAKICLNCHGKALAGSESMKALAESPEINKLKTAIKSGTPIAWLKVHDLPDHVYFNHSVHVRKGVACETCHGDVRSMGRVVQFAPLTMGWCIDCHRGDPAAADYDRGNALTDCAVCHH